MSKHTPGPWTAGSDRGYGHYNGVQITDDRSGLVLAVAIGDVPELKAQANARLIAAAPELLAALLMVQRELACVIPGAGNAIVDAAIAKAQP
jgi:hypothetical protein